MESHELTNLFKDLPDAIENNQNFKYRFSYFPKKSKPLLPSFIEDDNKVDGLLKDEAQKGLLERLEMFVYPNLENMNKKDEIKKEYQNRLDYEVSVISNMKFSGYFLIVSDFINWA